MKWISLTVCACVLFGCAQQEPEEPSDHFLRVLSFPSLSLGKGERISGLEITMLCGRFRSVNIPNDWSLEIEGPVSERSILKATANHGTAYLSDSSELAAFVTVMVCSTSSFDIAATVFTATVEGESEKKLDREQVKLKKVTGADSRGKRERH